MVTLFSQYSHIMDKITTTTIYIHRVNPRMKCMVSNQNMVGRLLNIPPMYYKVTSKLQRYKVINKLLKYTRLNTMESMVGVFMQHIVPIQEGELLIFRQLNIQLFLRIFLGEHTRYICPNIPKARTPLVPNIFPKGHNQHTYLNKSKARIQFGAQFNNNLRLSFLLEHIQFLLRYHIPVNLPRREHILHGFHLKLVGIEDSEFENFLKIKSGFMLMLVLQCWG